MTLNVEVRDELGVVLEAHARAQGVSPDRIVTQVLEDAFTKQAQPVDVATGDVRPIWEVIVDNMRDVPLSEYEKLPKDGSAQVDHYLYRHPKR